MKYSFMRFADDCNVFIYEGFRIVFVFVCIARLKD